MSELKLNVITVYDNKLVSVPYTIDKTTAEDVCIHICKHLCIGTLARHLFGLRVAGKHYFLMPSATFNEKPGNLEFRVRFKPASIKNLLKIDPKCYDYYFHQARQDVHENKIPEITFDKFRRELVGLGVTDMYRVMLEKDIPRETVEREYKNYIPKEVLRKHQFFIKKPIHETLGHLQKYLFEASYVKAEYLRQLDIIAPDYLTEVYKAVVDEEGSVCNINVKLSPYHPTEPGLKYSYESKKDQWHLICTVEELGFVSIRNDGTIELARKNGIPFYVKFSSNSHMHSFISLLDGYYRLTCKWIYNLCKDVVTPSLKKLCAMRCHGPVGGEFSYEKLEEKRNNKPGCFIIRESEFKYNSYFIDVCAKDSLKPKTYRLERIKDDEFIFNDDLTKYKTIHQLMAAYNDPNEPIFLQECLPPTEYDISPLLLCQSENLIRDSLTDSSALSVPSPLCISWKDLQVYKGHELIFHVRAVHSATILLCPTPTYIYPNVKIILRNLDNMTRILVEEYEGGPRLILKEIELPDIVDYWKWSEFSISLFADTLQIYMKKAVGTHMLAEVKHNAVRVSNWFSVCSDDSVVHWSFYCTPPSDMQPQAALLPECAMNVKEPDYKGTQEVTNAGLPCLPWSAQNLINDNIEYLFDKNNTVIGAWNYCRDLTKSGEGTYCYTISRKTYKIVEKSFCRLRKCKSEHCKMAGTGNDFVGQVSKTRSGRTCDTWPTWENLNLISINKTAWNDTLFPDLAAGKAKNFCRNPSRDITGSWCYTTDAEVFMESCFIKDCDKPEECIVITESLDEGHRIFILPQWKESGIHGGLRFAIKEWNADFLDGIIFHIYPRHGPEELQLHIGAELNQKILFYVNGNLEEQKTLPHLIAAGKWTNFWLQIRKGKVMLGFEGIPDPLFEWGNKNIEEAFEPMFLSYTTMSGKPMGLFFKSSQCHTENITVADFKKTYPIGLWSEIEQLTYTNFSFNVRGVGIASLQLTNLPNSKNRVLIEFNTLKHIIALTVEDFEGNQLFQTSPAKTLFQENSWSTFEISFNETILEITTNNSVIFKYESENPLLFYWFSVGSTNGWLTWSVNCPLLDLDGPPKNGGWSAWSPWTCTVSCGGGEGFRTRTCSNPHPNIFGKLCQGSPTATGRCNDFPCGDISPKTLEKIRDHLKAKSYSSVIKENDPIVIQNDKELLRNISKESPASYYEWTLNGVFINSEKGHVSFIGQKKEGLRGITMVYRSMWKVSKGKKIEVAMKVLKQENSERFLKEFLSLAGQWAFLQSSAIVRIYGITLTSNISLVLEYFRLGPLDHYLKENRNRIKPEDLIEAASNLACALWHLKENDIVHGNIRCRKLMVHTHDEKSFKIKLTDPGIHNSYPPSEVHWIPVECYTNLDFAKKSAAADVWAFATTLWEIYMFGEELRLQDHVKSRHFYASGKRLPRPQGCPSEIYELMKECWDADPHRRKQPQAINRDINQILYQVYNSRKTHSYAKVFNKNMNSVAGISSQSLDSNATEVTTLGQDGDLISATDICSVASCSSVCDKPAQTWSTDSDDGFTYDMSNFMSNLNTLSTSLDSLCSMQSIFELERDSHVVLQGRIGQGFYGEVYKGTLEFFMDTDREPRRVAVKKLKSSDVSSSLQDFEREINIMKSLKHPNIVEILGVSRDPEISLVMEYVPHGSLQSYLKIYKDSLSTYQRLKYALDIAKGMQYLGKKNIVHRDLATRNILVVDENNVKISDFGLAQVIGTNDYYILKTNRELPIKWYALESLRDGKFSVRSDVWSYGVTLCEMFNNGEEPNLAIMTDGDVPEQQLLLHALEQGTRLPCPPNCDQVIYIRIIHPCWAAVPQDRPLFSQIVLETEDLLAQYK